MHYKQISETKNYEKWFPCVSTNYEAAKCST